MASQLSKKMRAYMADIYRLIERQPDQVQPVTSSQLAEQLLISPPAVTRMVNRLSELGLLTHQRYRGIGITEAGRREALRAIRIQRIAEVFLVRVMDLDWLEAHEEAHRLAEGLSPAVVQRMFVMAGEPARCPHGEPIPAADGSLPEQRDILLSEVEAGSRLRITRLTTRESDRLQYIAALGLLPGVDCELIHVAPFEGPLQLQLGREFRIIGRTLAQLIRAEVLA